MIRRLLLVRASQTKKNLQAHLEEVVRRTPDTPRVLSSNVFSHCGADALLDQVVSLRSFLRAVGEPKRFTVVSDGSLDAAQKALLEANHPCVRCCELDKLQPPAPPALATLISERMGKHYLTKKLLMLLSVAQNAEPSIYFDSDVLFFPSHDVTPLLDFQGELFYQPDALPVLDPRLVTSDAQHLPPVNSGLALFG